MTAQNYFAWFGKIALLMLLCVGTAWGQSSGISGYVRDKSEAIIPKATVTITNIATGVKRTTVTNKNGYYSIALLDPATYKVTIEVNGFRTLVKTGVILEAAQNVPLDFVLTVGDVSTTVQVSGDIPNIDLNPSISTEVDQDFVKDIPLNGRSFQSLLLLTPGVIYTANEQGQLSVNGQRTDANYFTIDGVSANISTVGGANGLGSPTGLGFNFGGYGGVGGPSITFGDQSASGSMPGFNSFGGTNNLISVDDLQEVKVQTSTYSSQYGREPGAQVNFTTRSGTNQFHGSVYDYLRNSAFDANDYFSNLYELGKTPSRQNDFGGTFGGPIFKNRTFFFFSYEGLRLALPQPATQFQVPAACLHGNSQINQQLQEVVDAFPKPNDGSLTDPTIAMEECQQGYGTYLSSGYDNYELMNSYSIRVDQTVNSKLSIFGRYNRAPSNETYYALASEVQSQVNTDTFTVGATATLNNRMVNSLRWNYSQNGGVTIFSWTNRYGVTPVPLQDLAPSVSTSKGYAITVDLPPGFVSYTVSSPHNTSLQRQWNLVDDFSWRIGNHNLTFGEDIRVLDPKYATNPYSLISVFIFVPSVLSNTADIVAPSATFPVTVSFKNFSTYANDTWQVNRKLTFNYGVRWEVNPPPQGTHGNYLTTILGLSNLSAIALAPPGTPLYPTRYGEFAPRLGASYQLRNTAGRETVLRGGWGIYYDLGAGTAATAAQQFPYTVVTAFGGVPYPPSGSFAIPPPRPSLTPPYGPQSFTVFGPNYVLPRTYDYSLSLEQALGKAQTLTVSYVGNQAHRLLQRYLYYYGDPTFNPNFFEGTLNINRNDGDFGGFSYYNAMQVQFMRRMTKGFQILANYTWSHATDSGSSDTVYNVNTPNLDVHSNYGNSDFDYRHLFNLAAVYNFPTVHPSDNGLRSWLSKIFVNGWQTDYNFKAQSAGPINVVYNYVDPSVATLVGSVGYTYRADRVPGVPLWVPDPNSGSGMALNPNAFAFPASAFSSNPNIPTNGDLGRNSIRGFGLTQLDFAVRRTFPLHESLNLQFSAEVFNVLNHPNFGAPDPLYGIVYGTSQFGTAPCPSNMSFSCTLNFPDPRLLNVQPGAPPPPPFFGLGTFGESISMAAGNPLTNPQTTGGLSSRFSLGGPRSMQFSLRLLF